jgi:chondroitin AC lyase
MVLKSVFVLSILLLPLLLIPNISCSVPNDDITIIRQRVLELTIWPPPENISHTVWYGLHYSDALNSSCYWPDINYADQGIALWNTLNHMNRLTVMVQALTANGSTAKNDSKLRTNVHCALNVWLVNDWENPGWWFNQIGVPLQITAQLLMLGDNVTSFETQKIVEISYRAAWWLHRPTDVGANVIWMVQCELYRSLATNNLTGIEQSFSRLWEDVVVSKNSSVPGIEADWAYHFHNVELLAGSYGVAWANNIFLFIICSQNTQYQPDDQILSIFVNFLTKGDAWMIMGNIWDWHTVGRNIAGPGNGFAHGLSTSWFRSIAKLVKSNETRVELLNFADRLDNLPNATLLIGDKHFFTSDYHVHRRPNWIATIKMQSMRTQASECWNYVNLKGEHLGQGVLNLYRTGFNDYLDIFPLLDWQAINGITVEHDIPLEPCVQGGFREHSLIHVGGVSDGQFGSAMMDTASHNLTAKRSWHFYDDAIIALATNLTLRTSTTAWTTLASRLLPAGQITIGFFNSTIVTLNDGNYSFLYVQNSTSNVQWVHVGGSDIAYLLQLQQQYASLGVQVGMQTGNYSAIGPWHSTVTARMLTVYISHGVGPYILDYNYMILPNVSLESVPVLVKQYDEEQVFGCISSNDLVHATTWPTSKRASVILFGWYPTTVSCKSPMFELNMQLSDGGAYLFTETDTDFTITVSHPYRLNSTMQVTVDRVGTGEGCTVSSGVGATTTKVMWSWPSAPELKGASVNVTCKK